MPEPAARRRYLLDATVQRHGQVVIGGSPLKLFRLTAAGADLVDRIADGEGVVASSLVTSLLDAGAIHPIPEATPYSVNDVTIVTPTYGPPPMLAPGALLVDDGSPEPVAGAAARLERNSGPGPARNAGLALVTTPLVAFVDNDVTLRDGWLEPLLAHFDDPAVALVAPRVRSAEGESVLARYERRRSPLDLGPEPGRVRAGSRIGYVPSAAIVCRVDAVQQVGGFAPALRFGEDVDLVWRLDEAGWRCRYEPASEVIHAPRPTWAAWVRQRVSYGSSAAPLARRHGRAVAPIRMSGWSVTTWWLGVLGRPVLGAAVGAGSAAALVAKLPDVAPTAAFRLAALGNLHAGDQIANAIRRAWWPIVLLACWRSRSARRALIAALLAARTPLRLADDLMYSVGVWRGVVAERTLAPLIPEITAWPGRSQRPG
jgi:mycofactocin system glycosyltransferase